MKKILIEIPERVDIGAMVRSEIKNYLPFILKQVRDEWAGIQQNSMFALASERHAEDSLQLTQTNLSLRILNALGNRQIFTAGDLRKTTKYHLFKMRNFGKQAMKELEVNCAVWGIKIGEYANDGKENNEPK